MYNEIRWQRFKALLEGSKEMVTNRGFQMREGHIATYEQKMLGQSHVYLA